MNKRRVFNTAAFIACLIFFSGTMIFAADAEGGAAVEASTATTVVDSSLDETSEAFPDELSLDSYDSEEYELIFEEIEVEVDETEGFKFNITGSRTAKWRDASSSGNNTQFESNNGLAYYDGTVEQASQISLFGTHPKGIFVRGDFSEMPYQDRTLTLAIESRKGKVRMGDFSTTFPGAKMTTFSKRIRGLDFSYNFGNLKINAITSQQKSQTKTETFMGQNLRGPYKLKTTSILDGSEIVKIDGGILSKSMYNMDYFRGEITFTFNIDPVQKVEITYESELLLSFKTGSINGMGVEYQPANRKYQMGFSYQSEGTNALAKNLQYSDTSTFNVVVVGQAYDLGRSLLDKHSVIVKDTTDNKQYSRTDSDGVNYEIDYAKGIITFQNAAITGHDVTVDFYYYNAEFVESMIDEELMGQGLGGGLFDLLRTTIYAGTEDVRLFYSNGLIRRLDASDENVARDYEINEGQNRIVLSSEIASFLSNPDSEYSVKISYSYVQSAEPETAESERTVYDAYLNFKPFKFLALETEVAQTKADLYPKTVQVLEEYVATVSDASQTVYLLANNNVVDGSVKVYYDNVLSFGGNLYQDKDFTLEHASDTDKLVFLHDLPVGRTIVADYKYRPSYSGDREQTGNAYRVKADFILKRLSLTGELVTKDSAFSPLNAYNNMRDDQLTASMNFKATEKISLFSNYNTFKDSYDFNTDKNDEYEELSGGVSYKGDNLLRELSYVRTEASRVDTATGTHFIDNTKEVDAVSVQLNVLKDDKLVLDTLFENTAFDDNTGRLSDREIEKRHYGVIIKPSDKLGIETYYEMVDVASIAPSSFGSIADFGVTTYSKKLLVNYYPNEIWALSGDMLLQAKTDSRPDMNSSYQDSARVSLAANPFGDFTYVNAVLYRKDIPDELTGGTRTDMLGFDFGYKIATKWVMEPSFNKTLSKVGDTSRSDSETTALNFSFNPERLGQWAGGFRYQDNSRKSSSSGASTTASDNQYILTLDYFPSDRLDTFWKYDRKDSSSDTTSDVISMDVAYKLTRKIDTTFNFTRNKQSTATTGSTRDYYILSVDYFMSKTFDLRARVERQEFSSVESANDYVGYITSLEFTAHF